MATADSVPPGLTPAAVSLVGRTVLVTGASRGIGATVAVRLARAGARVAVTARTADAGAGHHLAGSLAETLQRIAAVGATGVAVVADLADAEDRARIVGEVEAALGPVDVLVNNAAAAMYAPVADMPLRRRRVLFELNVHAPLDLAQAVVPGMRARGGGSIVMVSTALAAAPAGPPWTPTVIGTTGTVYGASKAALERLSMGLAEELAPDGIAVNVVAPVAAVRSEGAQALVGDLVDAARFEPVEHLCEAIAHLATCTPDVRTGQVRTSADLLHELGLLAPPPT